MVQVPGAASSKVFGIGLPRTATTSVAAALLELGYRTGPCYFDEAMLGRGDAFLDTPVYADYPELDGRYPGSKFILTWRDPAAWLASFSAHLRGYLERIRDPDGRAAGVQDRVNWRCYRRAFGAPGAYGDAALLAGYRGHRAAAEAYFRARPADLLILDPGREADPWGPLCSFLGRPRPDRPFPRLNAQEVRAWEALDHPGKVPSWPPPRGLLIL